MSLNSSKTLNQIVSENSSLRLISNQVCRFRAHKNLVLQYLPKDYATHCNFVIIKEKSLVLYVDSPVWCNRFRYLGPELLSALKKNADFQDVIEVSVRTLITDPGPHFNKSKTKLGKISAETIATLKQVAIHKPGPLRDQLLRLAAHLAAGKEPGE